MILDFPMILGLLGAICVVVAFSSLQFNIYTHTSYHYLLINLAGGLLLGISLLYHFNLGSFIIELVWISVSLYGLSRRLLDDARNKQLR